MHFESGAARCEVQYICIFRRKWWRAAILSDNESSDSASRDGCWLMYFPEMF
jgi:hypothetical protein